MGINLSERLQKNFWNIIKIFLENDEYLIQSVIIKFKLVYL